MSHPLIKKSRIRFEATNIVDEDGTEDRGACGTGKRSRRHLRGFIGVSKRVENNKGTMLAGREATAVHKSVHNIMLVVVSSVQSVVAAGNFASECTMTIRSHRETCVVKEA